MSVLATALPGRGVHAAALQPLSTDLTDAVPAIVVGVPPDAPADHVDLNVPTSAFSGVVAIQIAHPFFDPDPNDEQPLVGFCSGVAVSSHHVLTAGHCVDFLGGQLLGGSDTGDGTPDATPGQLTVVFNEDNLSLTAGGASLRGVTSIVAHPDWEGFNNVLASTGATINDDVAILTLSAAIPPGALVYPIDTAPFDEVTAIVMAGYGSTGTGTSGETTGPSFFVKRVGQNVASLFANDDEAPFTAHELFGFDFDHPTNPALDADTIYPGLGNEIEANIASGDSGGPSFEWFDDGDDVIEPGELTLFGINTYGQNAAGLFPRFGSLAGGPVIAAAGDFIAATVPEPVSAVPAALGALAVTTLVRRRRRL